MAESIKNKGNVSKRDIFRLVGNFLGMGSLALLLKGSVPQSEEYPDRPLWPTDREGILNRIKELNLPPGSELSTTFFPRKIMYEVAEMLEMQGKWNGEEDKSDWMNNKEIIEKTVERLAESGFNRCRVVIAPFEVTKDGKEYDWSPMKTILGIMENNGMVADLCLGPLDYPYGPAGIRVPKKYEELLNQELHSEKDKIQISLEEDPNHPKASALIRDYALNFYDEILKEFGGDSRIGKFFISNEWPDDKLIENVNGRVGVSLDFMRELVKRGLKATDKKIALNTNIHPSDLNRMEESGLAELIDLLGDRGELGLDAYYTEEVKDWELADEISRYGQHVDAVRSRLPNTEIIFVELQGEPWPGELSGDPWAEIISKNAEEVVIPYYQDTFPPTLEMYVEVSKIKEVGFWGAPLWIISDLMGYPFPLEMMQTLSETMNKRKASKS